jgi:CHAT domain-containing protein
MIRRQIRFLLLFLSIALVGAEAAQRSGGGGGAGSGPRAAAREQVGGTDVKQTPAALEAKAREAEKNGKWEEASIAYRMLARGARAKGQPQKAIDYAGKALESADRAKDPILKARTILELINVYRFLGQSAKSRELSEKGIEIVKQIPAGDNRKSVIEADMYREVGFEFLRGGDADKAIQYISYSLQVQDSLLSLLKRRGAGQRPQAAQKIQRDMVATLARLGQAHLQAGNPPEAIKAFERGLATVQSGGSKQQGGAGFFLGLGQAYLAQKDFPRALENLTRALKTAGRGRIAIAQGANAAMGDLFLETRRAPKAIPFYARAIEAVESVRSRLESEELRSSFFESKGQIYSGMVLAHLAAGSPEEAFNYNERARSRAFLDILGSKVQLTRQADLLEEERTLQAKLAGLKGQLSGGAEDDEEEDGEPADLGDELEAAEKAYNDFLAKVRKANKEQASLMNVEPLALKDVQSLLDPGVTLVEYFVTQRQTLVWVVEKDRVEAVSIALGRKDLLAKVSALRDNVLQVGEKEKFAALSRDLYQLLVAPALAGIRGKELLIVPHDVLHYLPFQALLSPDGRYLVQDFPIHYLSSASLMQFTHAKRRAAAEKALVMGNPSLGDEAYNLRFAEREAKEVATVYPQSAVYLRAEASKPRAISLSPNYDMLHFAVHAEFNEEDPMSSALLLAVEGKDDGRLKVEEIFSLDLKTSMVVLSACETGLGKLSSGDEIVGLTRAFIYAGTPSIVTTLWKVNDRASYELMREFYRNLKSAKKSEALRLAQLKTMQEFPEPFYWAAYQLTGEP